MRYVIVGNSAAAVCAVDAIRELDAKGEVTMVSPEDRPAYGTPLISYVLEGKTDVEHADIRDDGWYARNGIACQFGEGKAAVALDAAEKTVTLADGTCLPYDKLLVACGSVPADMGVEGLSAAPNSFSFNTMDDALAILSYLDGPLAGKRAAGEPVRAVIAGSGLIGTKAAEGICGHVDETYLVGHAPRVLRKLLDEESSPLLEELMAKHGVTSIPSAVIESVKTDEEGAITQVRLSDGRELSCDLVIGAIGVRPNAGLLERAGAKVARGVVCDRHMQTSLPDVYAAGDVACVHDLLSGGEAPLALWPVACEQGRVAGRAMAGDAQAAYEGGIGRNAVGFFGEMSILGCGIVNPPASQPDIESTAMAEGSSYRKFNVRDGKLVGYLLVNCPQGAGIYTKLIEERIDLDELPGDVLERAPELLDLPRRVRDAAVLEGYSRERSA